ncbi:hypothetical protein J3A83DRAFT_4232324 [Scleroderma citrinum]
MEIVKAFGYGRAYLFPSSSFDADHLAVAGNFYNCSNGHMFIIGDCGGAMRVSTGAECGATIGGSDHRLLPSNS